MGVTQTYLGCPDPEAKLFVYYLWEEYKEQEDVPKEIIKKLSSAGRAFGRGVTLFAPIPGAPARNLFRASFSRVRFFLGRNRPNTPCLFLTTKPIGDLDPHGDTDEYSVFRLPREMAGHEDTIERVFASLHEACAQKLQAADYDNPKFLEQFYNAILLQPNFFGIGINLRPMLSWVLRKRLDRKRER